MDVRLKVVKGSNVGKEVHVPTPQCLIGRSEECHLRPQSDAVSRRHCVILVNESEVVIRDLNSRNGVFLNNEKVEKEALLIDGDMLKIGPLEFVVCIEQTAGKPKRPKVQDVRDIIARTADAPSSNSTAEIGSVADWLDEADAVARAKRLSDPETKQFKLQETDPAINEPAKAPVEAKKPEPAKPKEPGKLPPRPGNVTKDSRDAASETLKKLFKR